LYGEFLVRCAAANGCAGYGSAGSADAKGLYCVGAGLGKQLKGELGCLEVGCYPIVALQYSSTSAYQVSYHIHSLFF
jgi:hypothetical protein